MSVTYDWLNFGSDVITRPVTVAGTDSRGTFQCWYRTVSLILHSQVKCILV